MTLGEGIGGREVIRQFGSIVDILERRRSEVESGSIKILLKSRWLELPQLDHIGSHFVFKNGIHFEYCLFKVFTSHLTGDYLIRRECRRCRPVSALVITVQSVEIGSCEEGNFVHEVEEGEPSSTASSAVSG